MASIKCKAAVALGPKQDLGKTLNGSDQRGRSDGSPEGRGEDEGIVHRGVPY